MILALKRDFFILRHGFSFLNLDILAKVPALRVAVIWTLTLALPQFVLTV